VQSRQVAQLGDDLRASAGIAAPTRLEAAPHGHDAA
jgi:hypothetical protein